MPPEGHLSLLHQVLRLWENFRCVEGYLGSFGGDYSALLLWLS